jgi:DUF177 domain-containing protein
MIRFDVSTLTKAQLGASLTLSLDTGPQTLGELEIGFLRGTLHAIRVQGGVLVQGSVDAQIELDCVRCLETYVMSVTLGVEETFRLPEIPPTPDQPYAMASDGSVDLAPLLRELTWLAIPLKPVCRPDCNGLCPQCGTNLNYETCQCQDENIDPRWALLQDLLQ